MAQTAVLATDNPGSASRRGAGNASVLRRHIATHQMLCNNAVHSGLVHAAVPRAIGVHHHDWAEIAGIEAAGAHGHDALCALQLALIELGMQMLHTAGAFSIVQRGP